MILADYHIPRPLRRTVAQMARVCCPPEVDELDLVAQIVDAVEIQLRAFPTGFRLGMTAGLAALETGAILRFGRPFSRLSLADAQIWFHGWWHSPISAFRNLAKAIKALISLAFYQSAPMRERLSYHPDRWIAEMARKRLERFGFEIERHEEELRAPNPLHTIRKVRHA